MQGAHAAAELIKEVSIGESGDVSGTGIKIRGDPIPLLPLGDKKKLLMRNCDYCSHVSYHMSAKITYLALEIHLNVLYINCA